jgi:beta-N-acetylhexosaminidase
MAEDLRAAGITIDCLPVLDVVVAGSTEAIGSRSYGMDPNQIIALAQAHVAGLLAGGVVPVMKHIPGHGRAMVDSHLALPVVTASRAELEQSDFVPFAAFAHLPIAMTAHIVFAAIDKLQPATHSKTVIAKVIRKHIGFQGLLVSDDMSMKALKGSPGELARIVRDAGCDLALHCNGNLDEMRAVAEGAGLLTGKSLMRARAALKWVKKPQKFDKKLALSDLSSVISMS